MLGEEGLQGAIDLPAHLCARQPVVTVVDGHKFHILVLPAQGPLHDLALREGHDTVVPAMDQQDGGLGIFGEIGGRDGPHGVCEGLVAFAGKAIGRSRAEPVAAGGGADGRGSGAVKQAGGGNYFEELLARIRDIRSSERVFWRKVLDIYSTSIDYDPKEEQSLLFFKTVQNKMHWAAHGQTAAEVVHARADASLPNMGLTTFDGDRPRKADVSIAKNYLKEEEIEALNRIVTAYLEFAELQAMNRKPMHMADWISKLDDFLRLSDREILTHAGKISHDSAKEKAETEFAQFKEQQRNLPQPVDQHFAESLDELKKIEGEAKQAQKKKPTKKTASKKKPSKKSPRKKKGKDED